MSIVELMVGIAVGLIVVAAASMTVATQLSDNRRLLLEVQVQQDLRAAADIITRDLRRIGYWQAAATQVWVEGAGAAGANPRAQLVPASGPTNILEYRYDRRFGGVAENTFGFCQGSGCAAGDGVIRTKFAAGSATATPGVTLAWQPLTDDKAVNITAFTITPIVSPAVRMACPNLCPGTDDTACWPTVAVREAVVTITGQAISDPSVQRTLTSRVRLRNDQVTLSAPAGPPCPQ